MTDHSDLVARLYDHARNVGGDPSFERLYGAEALQAAALIETQAAELERLRGVLGEVHSLFEDGIAGVDHRGFQQEGEVGRYIRVRQKLRATAIEAGSHLEEGV